MSDVEALRALTEADRWIERVRGQRERLPELAELATVEEELRALAGALTEARAAQAPVRAAYEDAERESARLRQREAELAAALAASTGHARELAALQNEVSHVREVLGAAEDRELELLLAVEPLDETVNAIKQRAQPAVVRRETLRAAIAQLQASLGDEAAALARDRATLADAVAPALRARYDDALVRAGTSGAALVVEGRCDGCRLRLSPLDFDRWRAQAGGSFLTCPSCGRLLLP
ncbi:MAG: zinc ribbon domain-containing protein [Acidimicrobiales bacterium]